jgi:hypothetical protein
MSKQSCPRGRVLARYQSKDQIRQGSERSKRRRHCGGSFRVIWAYSHSGFCKPANNRPKNNALLKLAPAAVSKKGSDLHRSPQSKLGVFLLLCVGLASLSAWKAPTCTLSPPPSSNPLKEFSQSNFPSVHLPSSPTIGVFPAARPSWRINWLETWTKKTPDAIFRRVWRRVWTFLGGSGGGSGHF